MNNEFRGFSLFNDQDEPLRSRNRAVVMCNIAEDNMNKENKITPKGVGLLLGYMNAIPQDERKEAALQFGQGMNQRGFAIQEKPVAIH